MRDDVLADNNKKIITCGQKQSTWFGFFNSRSWICCICWKLDKTIEFLNSEKQGIKNQYVTKYHNFCSMTLLRIKQLEKSEEIRNLRHEEQKHYMLLKYLLLSERQENVEYHYSGEHCLFNAAMFRLVYDEGIFTRTLFKNGYKRSIKYILSGSLWRLLRIFRGMSIFWNTKDMSTPWYLSGMGDNCTSLPLPHLPR